MERGAGAGRRCGAIGKIRCRASVLVLPDRPQTVDVAMMKEEDRIVRRGPRLHRSIDPAVNRVVDLPRANHAFERVAKAGRGDVPRIAVVTHETQSWLHAVRCGQARAIAAEMPPAEAESFLAPINGPS